MHMYLVRHSKVEYRHNFRHEDVEHRQGSLGVFCGLYGVNWFEGILSVGYMKKMGYME